MDPSSPPPVPDVPAFQATSIDVIPAITSNVRSTFNSHHTLPLSFRLVQLRKLYWAVTDYESMLIDALARDIRKCSYETVLTELELLRSDCLLAIGNLAKWARDEAAPHVPLHFRIMRLRITKKPIGSILIIGTYNFPYIMTLQPLIGAIAAGCTAVVKPSEHAPASAAAIARLVADYLDPTAYTVVNGGVPETTALLNQKWDKILYTGGGEVARIIARKAAETLTPCALELGGVNPVIVTRKCSNLALAARRILWPVALNAGQVCLKHNYVLAERDILPQLVEALKKSYQDFFPNGARQSPEYARIINQRHFDRISGMLKRTRGQVVLGGAVDEADLYIEPTVVLVEDSHDCTVREEAFGPIMALMPFDTLNEAIGIINDVDPTPLALYSFGSDEENATVLAHTTSGGASLNDSFIHASVAGVPFGGIGSSGMGSYRGRASYDLFTHRRTVGQTPYWAERFIRVRYLPYSMPELKRLVKMRPRPDFDRTGAVVRGPRWWVSAILRWGVRAGLALVLAWWLVGF